jgi:hypothetical protein
LETHVDRTRLEEFLDVFQNGFPSGNSDFAAMALRNYITASLLAREIN